MEFHDRTEDVNPPNQPQLNIESQAEPDTGLSSTQVDSQGFDDRQTSSTTQPPSELVASPLKPSRAVVFDERLFVAPHMDMDPEILATWNMKICERLSKDLEETGSGLVSLNEMEFCD